MSFSKNTGLLICFMVSIIACFSANAQTSGFIYIQSENNKPYTIQFKGNSYPSSETGYLLIPQVPTGEHHLVIEFPGKTFPAISFQCIIDDKPRGFSLRQAIDNTWSLFDLVSFAVIKGSGNTPAVQSEPLVLELKEPPVSQKPGVFIDTAVAKTITAGTEMQHPQNIQRVKLSSALIIRIFEKASPAGIDQVYVVQYKEKSDTIALFIPSIKEEIPAPVAILRRPGNHYTSDTQLRAEGRAFTNQEPF